jgi:hypothetical protein
MYQVGGQKVPLCLNCYAVMQQTNERAIQLLREEMNHTMDHVNSMFGIAGGPRYPTKRPVIVSGGTVNNNHIAINNSQIGILNTGSIHNLNQVIDSLHSASQKELADALKKFTETVISESELKQEQRGEVLESLDIITKELYQKPENRKKSVAKTLLAGISKTVELAANSAALWQVLHPLLQKFF